MKIQDKIDLFIEDISQIRFTPYRNAYGSNIKGLRGYRYNIVVGQTIWEAAAVFEVILRNRIVKTWNTWFSVNGFRNCDWPLKIHSLHNQIPHLFPNTPLNTKSLQNLEDQELWAFRRARRELRGRTIVNGDVVARLTFGFWHECFSHHFRFINGSQIKDIFPFYPYQHTNIEDDISDISTDLQSIKDFRNRLAHHEKLNINRAKRKYAQICEYISYINPDAIKMVSADGFNHIINYNIDDVTRDFPYL